jgi:peptide/nickel transport system substrate-binding protein
MTLIHAFARRLGTAALAGLLAVLGGYAKAAPEAITVALAGDFPAMDPSKDTSPLGFNYRLNVFDALTELQRDGQMNPRLAESWTFSPSDRVDIQAAAGREVSRRQPVQRR